MVETKPRVRASTGVARELGASAMHRWEDYVACGAPQRARRSAMGGLSPQTFQGYNFGKRKTGSGDVPFSFLSGAFLWAATGSEMTKQ